MPDAAMALPSEVLAAVSDGHGHTDVQRRPLPAEISLLRVESSALCSTDVQLHHGGLSAPAVLGHHVVGRVVRLTAQDAAALEVEVGDRVAVEEYVGCGTCLACRAGDYRLCPDVDLWTGGERVGMIAADRASGLHGGNAGFLEIGSRHVLHAVPESIGSDAAAWTLPLANAVDWTLDRGGAGEGSRVTVIGPGYHGLACVAAARAAGAAHISLLGQARDSERLAYGRSMGAQTATSGTAELDRLARGEPSDVVVDTVGTPETVATATRLLGRGGVLVLAGLSGAGSSADLSVVVRKTLTLRGVRGRAPSAVRRAIELLAAGVPGLAAIPTRRVALDGIDATLSALHEGRGPDSPHVVIDPWREAAGAHSDPALETY